MFHWPEEASQTPPTYPPPQLAHPGRPQTPWSQIPRFRVQRSPLLPALRSAPPRIQLSPPRRRGSTQEVPAQPATGSGKRLCTPPECTAVFPGVGGTTARYGRLDVRLVAPYTPLSAGRHVTLLARRH